MAGDLSDVPPAGFVAARNAKVKELRAAGKADDAREVAALKKPTPAIFALNQVARHQPKVIEALLDATANLRQAQRAPGVPQQTREAMQAHRDALARLSEAAGRALDEAGLHRSQAIERKILDTAQGAALTDERKLREGSLEAEQPAPGFAALSGTAAAGIDQHRGPAARATIEQHRAIHQEQRAGTQARVASARETTAGARQRKQREIEERRQRVEERRREVEATRARAGAERELRRAVQEGARLDKQATAAEKAAERAREAATKAGKLAVEAREAAREAARREAALRARLQ